MMHRLGEAQVKVAEKVCEKNLQKEIAESEKSFQLMKKEWELWPAEIRDGKEADPITPTIAYQGIPCWWVG